MERNNNQCFCYSISEQIKESSGNCYLKYNLIFHELMNLERQGVIELFAGDCLLENIDTVLGAEQHYTVCQYI